MIPCCRGGTPIRVYGEIVDVLWKANQALAALRLESLWNQLAESYRFALLCGYSLNNAYDAHGRQEICACHTHVLFEPDEPRVH